MNKKIAILALAAGLSSASPILAQIDALRVYTAVEIEYQTERGKTYALQGSISLTNWVDVGAPVLGNGQTVNQIFSTKDSIPGYAVYRLVVTPGPTNGFAPWSLDGVRLQMDDSTSSNLVQFLTSTNGHDIYTDGDDAFTFEYSRLTTDQGRAERSYGPGRRDVVSYTYTAPGAGSWLREEYEQNVLKNREIGSFHYLDYGTNSPGTTVPSGGTPPSSPASLGGLVYYTFTGSSPDKYQFNTNNTGVAIPGSSSGEIETTSAGNIFTFSYNVTSSNTAELTINFGYYGIGGDRQEYDLTFNDGTSALFKRRIYRLGSLFTTDSGVFTPNGILPPPPASNGGETHAIPTTPPANPAGFTYTVIFSELPRRLVFQTTATGTEFDDSAPSTFSYTYAATGADTFHLKVTIRPDKWDEYDLTFVNGASGTMVVRRYDKERLKSTDSGSFSVTAN